MTYIEKEERGMYYLIHINGSFNFKSLLRIREAAEQAMDIGHRYIVFNLADTIHIDSGGIGLLININQKLIKNGGGVYLAAVPDAIKLSLEPNEILQTIPVVASIEEADKEIG